MLGLVKGQINNVSSRDLGAGLKGGMYCTCTYDRFRERGGREIGWQWNWGRDGPVRYAGKRIAYDIRYNIQYNLHMYHMYVSTVCCTIQYEPVSRSPTVK